MGVYELRYVVEKAMAIMCVETREVTVGGEGGLRWLRWGWCWWGRYCGWDEGRVSHEIDPNIFLDEFFLSGFKGHANWCTGGDRREVGVASIGIVGAFKWLPLGGLETL